MWRWLKWHDGAHVLNADKSEAGWYHIPDRHSASSGESNPEYVHHNYLHSDVYEKSRQARGAEGSNGAWLNDKYHNESRW